VLCPDDWELKHYREAVGYTNARAKRAIIVSEGCSPNMRTTISSHPRIPAALSLMLLLLDQRFGKNKFEIDMPTFEDLYLQGLLKPVSVFQVCTCCKMRCNSDAPCSIIDATCSPAPVFLRPSLVVGLLLAVLAHDARHAAADGGQLKMALALRLYIVAHVLTLPFCPTSRVLLLGCTRHVSEKEFEHTSWDEQRAENRAGKSLPHTYVCSVEWSGRLSHMIPPHRCAETASGFAAQRWTFCPAISSP
jgi:hypothetical protein